LKITGTYKEEESYTWYYVGGAALVSGVIAVLLGGKDKATATAEIQDGLPNPPSPPK